MPMDWGPARWQRPLTLPSRYRIAQFPAELDFVIPEFEQNYPAEYSRTLAVVEKDCGLWFKEFVDRIGACIGKCYLPVMRLSDGEFLFLLGEAPPDFRLSLKPKLRQLLSQVRNRLLARGKINTFTQGKYHSGMYSRSEWREARERQPQLIREIAKRGILALHLNYVREPFTERHFPDFSKWLTEHQIQITSENYYPFYFVYALLVGSERRKLFQGRRILVVNGATGEKKAQISAGLLREGASAVRWCGISETRSLYDRIDVSPFVGEVDIAVVGAGIGKASIFRQLEPLAVPCIDAGYIFQVWIDPQHRFDRVWCATDADWQSIGSSPMARGIVQ